jgi:uncharacterized protein (TIGR02246 family)
MQTLPADPIATVRRFVASINAGDIDRLAAIMTEDHRFIDATGTVHAGREPMLQGWRQYFTGFPDYRIEVEDAIAQEDRVAVFGWASGSFQGNPERAWRIPAAWMAVVSGDRIAEWRVYSDIEPMMRSMEIRREW